jgi:hypothetical protein
LTFSLEKSLSFLFRLSRCTCFDGYDSTKTIAGIAVTRPPSKKAYGIKEPFDTTGMEVTATYTDGTTGMITIGASDLDYDFSAVGGNKTVAIYRGGKSAEVTGITVQTLAQRIEAASSGDLITLYVDENIPSGLTLTKTITLKGSGAERTIGRNGEQIGTSTYFVTVGANGNLTLDSNITLNGAPSGSGTYEQHHRVPDHEGRLENYRGQGRHLGGWCECF